MADSEQKDYLIPLKDFRFIFKTIYTVLKNENANLPQACYYFSIIGAAILRDQYGIDAKPVCGVAAIRLNFPQNMAFGKIEDGQIVSDEKAFHCWIEADGWILDFISPLYGEMFAQRGIIAQIHTRMFQKPLSQMSSSFEELTKEGDFYLIPNPALTKFYVDFFNSHPMNLDFVKICSSWFKRNPLPMPKSWDIKNQHGRVTKLKLTDMDFFQAW